MKRGLRLAVAATLLTLASAGCAATDDVVESPSPPLAEMQPSERLLPAETTAALQACLTEEVSRLSHHAYDLSFEVQVTPRGTIQRVELEHGRLDDPGIEACMVRALEAMPLLGVVPLDESLSLSSPVLPSSRALLGTATVLPELIHLAPIVLSASGVTIVIGVGVIVLAAVATGEMSKECRREWKEAMKICHDLINSPNPPHGVTGGYAGELQCARGLVSMRCGGNNVNVDGQPARPGSRT